MPFLLFLNYVELYTEEAFMDSHQSPESVAHQLLMFIMNIENTTEHTRDYVLSTYAECLKATTGKYGAANTAPVAQSAKPKAEPKTASTQRVLSSSPTQIRSELKQERANELEGV
ncbi:MAG: hypothetical protein SFX19_07110 [Alphaproteobacteria bacterium]|nr:hypothetical protein [Alphaproteobacteria bacterium]